MKPSHLLMLGPMVLCPDRSPHWCRRSQLTSYSYTSSNASGGETSGKDARLL